MIKQKRTAALVLGCALIFAGASQAWLWDSTDSEEAVASSDDPLELTWDSLIPADYTPPEDPFQTMPQEEIDALFDGSTESNRRLAEIEASFRYAPTVGELHGKRVRIPAYITPLEFDGALELREFLLVPYMGACMHTPPPPANQIVHAVSDSVIRLDNAYDPVWAEGVLRTETVQSNLAEAGYTLEVEKISKYSLP